MVLMDEVSRKYSITIQQCCEKLGLERKRYQRWIRLHRETGRYGGGGPGPKDAPHRLLSEEREKIIELARDDRYMDLSHRQLAIMASESGEVEASASSFYRIMREEQLLANRQKSAKSSPQKPEVKPEGSNQIWSWDLTYIALGPLFVYLFAIIDVFSRKIVGWHLGLNARVDSMKKAWDQALSNEGLIGIIGAPQMPAALSDHGLQMAKKSAREFFRDLGIKQLFARYQTPTDNAWIESWFRILKYDWLRFKDYVSFNDLEEMIRQFVIVYNTQRYHGRIGYVTPEQKHSGQAEEIVKARTERKRLTRLNRLNRNRGEVIQIDLAQAA